MNRLDIAALALALPFFLLACNGDSKPQSSSEPAKTAGPPGAEMDAAAKELMARPEDTAPAIEIQHCLISFKGAPRMQGVTRTKDEAKALAEKVWKDAVGGADFLSLVKEYTNDSPPGIYPLDQNSRRGMVKSFGNVGWRLKVGEVGVAVWDANNSPYGWHIIKRLK